MSAKRASGRWVREHARDPYVRQAAARGYRSRAAFKLLQLNESHHLLRRGGVVVDLGAAPGGWSQVAAEKVGNSGRVIALDLLAMEPMAGVEALRGNFMSPEVRADIDARLGSRRADLVISDMAPNLSGVKDVDQARAACLSTALMSVALHWLKPEGALVVKFFQGTEHEALLAQARAQFRRVRIRKPRASRSESTEVYLLARR